MKHVWWHWFFTKTNAYTQMIPPNENGGKLLFVKNYETYCSKCSVVWKIDGLQVWRSGRKIEK